MPKQNNNTEEDYLDRLMNSVLSGDNSDSLFDEELKNSNQSDEEFFNSLEKDWMESEDNQDGKVSPENVAKEMFEKMGEEEQVVIDKSEESEKETEESESQKTEETSEEVEETEESQAVVEDEMQGLMDILGVPSGENQSNSEEIEELENAGKKRKKEKRKKRKKGIFGKKKNEESPEDMNLDIALDLMDQKDETPLDESAMSDLKNQVGLGEEEVDDDADMSDIASLAQLENPGKLDNLSDIAELGDELGLDIDLEEKSKRKKKKKEKKPKKKKDKKSKKAKKPKKPKKPKKEKGPKAPDEIIPFSLPIFAFVFSIGVLFIVGIFLGGNYKRYTDSVDKATTYYVNQNYDKAYDELYSLNIKKEDEYFYNQVQSVMRVYRNYVSYENLAKTGLYTDGLDSLLNGVRMFDKYKDEARENYNCYADMDYALQLILTRLNEVYGINESQAREINLLGKGATYSYRVAELAAAVNVEE